MVTEELEDELRRAFTRAGTGIEVPAAARTRLCERDYHPRRMHRGAVGAVGALAAAAATGIAVPLAVSGGPAAVASKATIKLASYTFTMPSGYHTVHGPRVCPFGIAFPESSSGTWQVPNWQKNGRMQSAASAAGGCIALALLPAYQQAPGSPDPFGFAGARSVRVGEHSGLIYRYPGHERPEVSPCVNARNRWSFCSDPGTLLLLVRLPVDGGGARDLVVNSNKLTERQLITIVASGLAHRS